MTRAAVRTWMDRAWYPGFSHDWDSDEFRKLILAGLGATDDLLDFGAGAGLVPQMNFRGVARHVTGLDPDPRVQANSMLDTGVVHSGPILPFDDRSFDVTVACNVLEHLADPLASLREIRRVLRPGGRFFFKTPNRVHYVALAAALTPHRFHEWYNAVRGREASHTFRTFYRANTSRALRRLAALAGFAVERLSVIEGRPEYLRVHPLLYPLGFAYEKVVNSSPLFETFRVVIIGAFRRE